MQIYCNYRLTNHLCNLENKHKYKEKSEVYVSMQQLSLQNSVIFLSFDSKFGQFIMQTWSGNWEKSDEAAKNNNITARF